MNIHYLSFQMYSSHSFKLFLLLDIHTCVCVSCSVTYDCAISWTIANQAPLSMGFSRQESWSGLPFPSPGDLPNPGSNLRLLHCRWILYQLSYQGSPRYSYRHVYICKQNGNILHIFVYKLFKLIFSHVTSSHLLLPLLIGDG